VISDLLGVSGVRILRALAEGEMDPGKLAGLADPALRATRPQLMDALSASVDLNPVYRRLLKMYLAELDLLEEQIQELNKQISSLLSVHQDAVQRLAEVPGLGVDSAHQIIAEVGATAATFATAKDLSSWVGVCPGEEESAEVNRSSQSPKGNRNLRRLLNQAAHAAVKNKGSIFAIVFQRLRRGLEYQEAIWAIAHRLCRLIWKILHQGVRYEERGPAVSAKSKRVHTAKMIRELRKLGYRVEPLVSSAAAQTA
jgi:transposase